MLYRRKNKAASEEVALSCLCPDLSSIETHQSQRNPDVRTRSIAPPMTIPLSVTVAGLHLDAQHLL